MNNVTITNIDLKAVDERGVLHYFSTDRSGEYLLVYRKAGSISGQHYHKGIAKGKNPEDMLLVQGELTLNWKNINTAETGSHHVIAPSRVIIEPHVWHEVIAVSDLIFIELNSLADGSEDTYRL
jgi:hypothetical protein